MKKYLSILGTIVFFRSTLVIVKFHERQAPFHHLNVNDSQFVEKAPDDEIKYRVSALSKVMFFNLEVGSISRTCAAPDIQLDNKTDVQIKNLMDSDKKPHPCWINLPHAKPNLNMNGPAMPIMVRKWMTHEALQSFSVVLFVSPFSTEDGIQAIGLDTSDLTGQTVWKKLNVVLNIPREVHQNPCKSLQSPSIIVDDEKQRLVMHIHVLQCEKEDGVKIKPDHHTLLLMSKDGISWDLHQEFEKPKKTSYLLRDAFYLSVPVYSVRDGYFYAMAKTQEDPLGSLALYRSRSLEGPFEEGPIIARGVRNVRIYLSTHPADSNMIYVFFTLIGDMPERILLGSIDVNSGSEAWMYWKLLPGPTLVQPEYWYESGNSTVKPSQNGAALESVDLIRDPRFLPDVQRSNKRLSGMLFYSVQGEQGIAIAKISIDLNRLHSLSIISYRNRTNISPQILKYTSLEAENITELAPQKNTVLITGVGRSGTTSLCTMFQNLGLKISHDNDFDCGPYPGSDGAVSWYDAFQISERRYTHMLHLVRHPLKQINSRSLRCPKKFLERQVSSYENVEDDLSEEGPCYKFALKHWVRRNSFVETHAIWRERVESLKSEPLSAWNLCMAGHFGSRCPTLVEFNEKIRKVPMDLNSEFSNTTTLTKRQERHALQHHKQTDLTWESLLEKVGIQNEGYVRIAQEMSRRYGYDFVDKSNDYACSFTMKNGDTDKYWDCFISNTEP
jgi:hypothetical protein